MLHDFHTSNITKQDVLQHVLLKKVEAAVVAEEPYGHQDGSHVHIFYRLTNPSRFKTQLDYWIKYYKSGRVQVDAMRGEISQACRYLMQDETKKDKTCDPSPLFYPSQAITASPKDKADEYFADWIMTIKDPVIQSALVNCMIDDSTTRKRLMSLILNSHKCEESSHP